MLDQLLAAPRKVEVNTVDLAAPPAAVWEHIRHADLADSPLVRALFALRTLPSRLGGRPAERTGIHIDDLRSSPERPGFQLLGEEPFRELTVGAIGKVWQLDIPFVHVEGPQAYASFCDPGWIKVAWAIRVQPLGYASSRVAVEVRVDATDDESWKKFTMYWRVIGPGSHLVRHMLLADLRRRFPRDTLGDVGAGVAGAAIMTLAWLSPFLRPERRHWGLSAQEAGVQRPGDELVPEPRWSWTHAVDIDAPAGQVWPWVAQIGADRGGFYSYQWLENLAGCNVRNAEAIHDEWAHTAGDALLLHPQMPPLRVVSVAPGRNLVAFAAPDEAARSEGRPWASASWAFLVEPLGAGGCRVVSRFRSACSDDLATRLAQGPALLEPVGFAMDRRMLLGIRDRVLATMHRGGSG